jgi:small subunit ribosomal protein S6
LAANANVYEAMFIFDSNRFARDRGALPGEVEQMIKSAGGEVLVSRLWEERRLAYPIKGHRKGTYWLMYFRAAGPILTGLNHEWQLNEGILRQLVLNIHPHLVDAVLEHAQAGPAEPVAVAAPAKVADGHADEEIEIEVEENLEELADE